MQQRMTTDFLRVERLAKDYGSTHALRDLTLGIAAGEIHALCGHNGAGKSTLVKLIAGLEQPDQGQISINGEEVQLRSPRDAERLGIAFVQQELSVLPTLSIEENVLLAGQHDRFLSRSKSQRGQVRHLLELVGLHHLRPGASAATLSAGERQLVEIARALGRDARLLILDEPTATLSDVEIERVFDVVRRLAANGTAVIFVSHRLGEVFSLCDRITVMRDGRLVATQPTGELTRPELISMMVGEAETTTLEEGPVDDSASVIVKIAGLQVPGFLKSFDLDIRAGEIVALAGQVGAGSSSVLRAIGGLHPDARGTVSLHDRPVRLGDPRSVLRSGVHFVSNDRKGEGLFLAHAAGSNLVATRLDRLCRCGVLRRGQVQARTRELASDVAFDKKRLRSPAVHFSGGNQQKVFVGRVLRQEVSGLILLDEPTRGVDVRGRAEIHDLVRRAAAEGNAVLFASTELDEVLDLATTVVTMRTGRAAQIAPRSETDAATILHQMTHSEKSKEHRD